jgi:hypothetical protein
MMDFTAFQASLQQDAPPAGLSLPLQALWHAGKGQWQRAHELAQEGEGDPICAWVHAHLHRIEGDESNAGYWYRRAGQPHAKTTLDEEWAAIATTLLAPR